MSAAKPSGAVVRQVANIDLCGYKAELGETELETLAMLCCGTDDEIKTVDRVLDRLINGEDDDLDDTQTLEIIRGLWIIRQDFERLATIKIEGNGWG